MRILVTGGAGYVGSHAARHLAQAGHRVWVFDNLSLGHRAAVEGLELIVADLADRGAIQRALVDLTIDAVMHFAALALVGESVEHPERYYQTNVVNSLNLLEAMRGAGVGKLVFSSTTATYGLPERLPISESQRQEPISPYGFTKLVVERAMADYASAHGLAYAALRYFNAAGASADGAIGEDHHPESHLIPIVLQVALGQRPEITIFGDDYPTPDGTCVRDYVHVDDLATAHLLALEKLEPGAALKLNLGTGRGYSVREVIDSCRRVTGRSIRERIGLRRAGDPPELVADADLARATLGWKPRYNDIDSIVATAWQWHSTHPRGYDDR